MTKIWTTKKNNTVVGIHRCFSLLIIQWVHRLAGYSGLKFTVFYLFTFFQCVNSVDSTWYLRLEVLLSSERFLMNTPRYVWKFAGIIAELVPRPSIFGVSVVLYSKRFFPRMYFEHIFWRYWLYFHVTQSRKRLGLDWDKVRHYPWS